MTVISKFSLLLLLLSGSASATDPTRPELMLAPQAVVKGESSVQLLPKLSLILTNPQGHQAMLDGQLRKTGDQLGPYRVKNITAGAVVLQQDERTIVLNLYKTTTK